MHGDILEKYKKRVRIIRLLHGGGARTERPGSWEQGTAARVWTGDVPMVPVDRAPAMTSPIINYL